MAQPTLVRPSQGRIIAGVALAIALRFDWNVTLVRIVTLLLGLFTGVGLLLYIVLWIVIPSSD
jgi:phage shock protein PspC (stress-responsive transcriptional regulator)